MTGFSGRDVPVAAEGDLRALVARRQDELARVLEELGRRHPRTLVAMARLAAALRVAGRLWDAMEYQQQTSSQLLELAPTWAPAAAAYSDGGVTIAALGEVERAAGMHVEALDHLLRITPALGPATLGVRENLAYALRALGSVDEAYEVESEIIRDLAEAYGPDHPATLAGYAHRAATLNAARRLDQAEAEWRRVAIGREHAFGASDPRTLAARANLGETLRDAGQIGEARTLHEDVLQELTPILGQRHPSVLSAMQGLARTYEAADQPRRAKALGEDVLAGRTETLGAFHPQTLASMRSLGRTLRTLDESDYALALAEHALRGHRRALGDTHPDTIAAQDDLFEALARAGKREAAEDLRLRTDELRSRGVPRKGMEGDLAAAMTAQDEFAEGHGGLESLVAVGPERLVRTPHLDVEAEQPLSPATVFRVGVYANRLLADAGDDVKPIDVTLAPGVKGVRVEVWLVASRHFEILDPALRSLQVLQAADETEKLWFRLRVVDEIARLGEEEPFVMAVFSHNGRPSGRVRKVVEVTVPVEARA
jgi:tetratricopeptide (TPR) repeat protein